MSNKIPRKTLQSQTGATRRVHQATMVLSLQGMRAMMAKAFTLVILLLDRSLMTCSSAWSVELKVLRCMSVRS